MENTIRPRARSIAWALTLVYFASYLMRINFAVMIVKICSDLQVEKTDLAIIVTALTITYGAGQVISGMMGDKIKPQLLLTVGLGLAAACNISMFFCPNIPSMTVVWAINGFAHSMLWPPIVRLMSIYLTDTEYSHSAVRVSWGSSFATILLYLLCPVLLYVLHWRVIMLLCAAGGIAVMTFWILINPRLFTEPVVNSRNSASNEATVEKKPLPSFVYLPVVLIMLGIVLQGILRDGVTNWMPSYMLETFHLPEEMAIISTVILAIFSVVSFAGFDFIQRKLFKNEVFCAAMIFVLSAVCAVVLYLIKTVFMVESVPVSMLLMAVIVACMHGINLMLITVVPKRFVKSGKVSTYSGLLNACTYVGAALSTYGFAAIADSFGWNFTVLSWVIVSALGIAVCIAAAPLWKRFRREYADDWR